MKLIVNLILCLFLTFVILGHDSLLTDTHSHEDQHSHDICLQDHQDNLSTIPLTHEGHHGHCVECCQVNQVLIHRSLDNSFIILNKDTLLLNNLILTENLLHHSIYHPPK
jgi:hypothetical protein